MLGCSHTHGIAWFAFYCGNEETNEIDGNIMFVWTKSRATSCNRLDRAWVWSNDWTSGGVESETLALEFSSRLLASKFKEMFELGQEHFIGPWILAARKLSGGSRVENSGGAADCAH